MPDLRRTRASVTAADHATKPPGQTPKGMKELSAGRCLVGGKRRLGLSGIAALLIVLAAACASSPSRAKPSTAGHATTPARVSTASQREGLALPSTYRQACASEAQAFGCLRVPAGPIPAALKHRLHFPVLRPGQHCPASRGTLFHTSQFGGIALGTGPVQVLAGSTRRGIADPINPTSTPPWLALKTLWFSLPAYQGPFVIRATRLGRPGPVALGERASNGAARHTGGADAQQFLRLPHRPRWPVG